jgi:Secretion system C-terminal sorting domain
MKTLISILVLILLGGNARAQFSSIQWQQCYGGNAGEQGHFMAASNDGGYILAGTAYGNDSQCSGYHGGEGDFWVVKITAMGVMQWEQSYGGSGIDEAYCIQQTSDGGYIVVGTTTSNDGDVSGNHGANDVWVLKISATGVLQWQKCLGGSDNDYGNAVAQTSDGGYILAGGTYSTDGDVVGNRGAEDVWVVRLDDTGGKVWAKTYGGSATEAALSVQQTWDGGFVFGGSSNSIDGDIVGAHSSDTVAGDIWVVKLSSLGGVQWQHPLGSGDLEYIGYTIPTHDSGYLVVGTTYSFEDGGDVTGFIGDYTNQDGWVVKLDSGGAVQWDRCIFVSSSEMLYGAIQTVDGSYLVCGTDIPPHDWKALYGKLTASGQIVYLDTLESGAPFYSVALASSGSGIVTGPASSTSGDIVGYHENENFWVVEFGWASSVKGVQEMPGVTITPNPTSGSVTIAADASIADVSLTNMLGQTVFEKGFAAKNVNVEVFGLPPGVYLVKVNGIEAGRLVKE